MNAILDVREFRDEERQEEVRRRWCGCRSRAVFDQIDWRDIRGVYGETSKTAIMVSGFKTVASVDKIFEIFVVHNYLIIISNICFYYTKKN